MKISQPILMKNNLFVSMENCVETESGTAGVSLEKLNPSSWLNYPPLSVFCASLESCLERNGNEERFVDGSVVGAQPKEANFSQHKNREKMSKRSSKKI